MRTAGGGQLQSQLSTEAAWALKHSLSLARRRGHAHVTPLHVAATLLISSSKPNTLSLNPFQSRALELCFNVALNRLPTTPTAFVQAQPSLSNALVAALKRAQAHQRRGNSIEHQQQPPILAIKIEVEQLILSILDDPSVSRVMREAGFSSVEIKNNIEENFKSFSSFFNCYSSNGGVYSSPPSPPDRHVASNIWQNLFWREKPTVRHDHDSEDIKLIMEMFTRKKRKNIVVVGDYVHGNEGLVSEIMNRIEKGDDIVPEELKKAHFIKFQFSSVPLRYMKREEVEINVAELKRKIDLFLGGGKRVIIYTGDLGWTLVGNERESGGFGYNPVEHLVGDIGKMISEYNSNSNNNSNCINNDNNNGRVWLMGTANYQTYMRCQMKQPSLEAQWCLQAVSVPSGGLGLSLHATGVQDSRATLSQKLSQVSVDTKPFCSKEENNKLTCCDECISKYEKEAATLIDKFFDKSSTQLPLWLKPHTTEMHKDQVVELRRKWNRLCDSQHHARPVHNNANSPLFIGQNLSNDKCCTYPYSNPSCLSPNKLLDSNTISIAHSNSRPIHTPSSYPRFRRQKSCNIEFSFDNGDYKNQASKPNLDYLKKTEGKEVKITLALGSSLISNSGKLFEKKNEVLEKLKENVPWQAEIVPLIVEALVKESISGEKKNWFLIEGNDFIGKRRLANGIAEAMFGSTDFLLHMTMKESENEKNLFCETLENALRDRENLVVLVENFDFADTQFLQLLGGEFEGGKFGVNSRKVEISGQKIFILAKNDYASYRDSKFSNSVIQMKLEVRETISDLGKKRKAEWDSPSNAKNLRINEKENKCNIDNTSTEKGSSRQSSSNTLDLNIKAEDEDVENENESEISKPSKKFLEMIKNRFVFDRDSTQDSKIKDMILSKITETFEEVCKSEGHFGCAFEVENKLLEEFLLFAGNFLDNQFEKWLKIVFETSLKKISVGGKGGKRSVRLCLDTKKETGLESSEFSRGSCLPEKIQVSFMG